MSGDNHTTDFRAPSVVEKYQKFHLARYYVGKRALLEMIGDVRGKSVVDIGCGGGDITAALHEAGANIVGVDRSEAFLEKAKSEYPDVRFQTSDACNMAFLADASVDVAVMFMVTFSIKDRKVLDDLFRETSRILKPGGHLVYGTIHPLMIENIDEPIRRVRLPEGSGYCHSQMLVQAELLLCDGSWIQFSDCHWTLQDIVSPMVAHGMFINGVSEPPVSAEDVAADPRLESLAKRPFYLFLKAQKQA
jgi:SAM-dependent methyltransferase